MKSILMVIMSLICVTGLCAGGKKSHEPARASLEQYVEMAKTRPPESHFNPGSLWVENGSEARSFSDFKARYPDDIVIIQISEVTNALSSGDAATSKKGNGSAGLTKFFGLEKKFRELPSLVNGQSENTFKGSGAAKRSQTLTSTVAARVIDVLPNGNLIIQAVKEIRVDNENQSLIISGVVRPRDINPQNVVSSNAIADMQIRLSGKGLVSEQLKPGFMQRLMMKVFPF
ncbi:MAG: flagellar basal body L-ring protein FlgH [Acidobacteria bacterium]|nr:flagellar basal body L-ring protein FlgH [Acidobacteriota bacterium]MBI3655598.1 flagellar basal body L-ring protein FlgH [Acidobacteriota bacterium]